MGKIIVDKRFERRMKSQLRFVQLHPIFYRILQLLGVFPFKMNSSGKAVKEWRLVALVFSFISVFYLVFYVAAYKAYLSTPTAPSNQIWVLISTFRIYISVFVINFTIIWNFIQRKGHAILLDKLKNLLLVADKIDRLGKISEDKILKTTFRKFIALSFFDWIISAPLVIYTNTFEALLWPWIFWACFTLQNFISNLLILYINHLTKLILHPVHVMKEVLSREEELDPELKIRLLQLYEGLFDSIRLFKSIYGLLIVMNFLYDFVFIVTQFFLFTFFVLNELMDRITTKEVMVILRSVVFITPNCAKLFAVTFTMEEVTKEVG